MDKMGDLFAILRGLAAVATCNRRKFASSQVLATGASALVASEPVPVMAKSVPRDIGNDSTDDADSATGCADGSDADSSYVGDADRASCEQHVELDRNFPAAVDMHRASNCSFGQSLVQMPLLRPPPGLENQQIRDHTLRGCAADQSETQWNAHARPFVPGVSATLGFNDQACCEPRLAVPCGSEGQRWCEPMGLHAQEQVTYYQDGVSCGFPGDGWSNTHSLNTQAAQFAARDVQHTERDTHVRHVRNAVSAPSIDLPSRLLEVMKKLPAEDAKTLEELFVIQQAQARPHNSPAFPRKPSSSITNASPYQHDVPSAQVLLHSLQMATRQARDTCNIEPAECPKSSKNIMSFPKLTQPVETDFAYAHHHNSYQSSPSSVEPSSLDDDNGLRANLRKLAHIDSARIFMVRKINKLGLNSAEILQNHFSSFAGVESVLVTHSIDKPKKPGQGNPNFRHQKARLRPAGIAFIVMETPEDVASILKKGPEQVVQGVLICVCTYERHDPKDTTAFA